MNLSGSGGGGARKELSSIEILEQFVHRGESNGNANTRTRRLEVVIEIKAANRDNDEIYYVVFMIKK